MPHLNRSSAALGLAVAAMLLSGCAAAQTDELTLVETKSSVQLLRNSVAGRVTAGALSSVERSQDLSLECGRGDPERRWFSSVNLNVTPSWVELMPALADALIASYEAEGWSASRGDGGQVTLVNDDSVATVEIASIAEDGELPARIVVEVSGSCVMTDGAGSDEVTALEEFGD